MANDLTIVCEIPDSVEMNRDTFKRLLRTNPTAKKYGFSVKHTRDISEYRKKVAGEWSLPSGVYQLPIIWNTEKTYFAK